jgi:hypothetical protein
MKVPTLAERALLPLREKVPNRGMRGRRRKSAAGGSSSEATPHPLLPQGEKGAPRLARNVSPIAQWWDFTLGVAKNPSLQIFDLEGRSTSGARLSEFRKIAHMRWIAKQKRLANVAAVEAEQGAELPRLGPKPTSIGFNRPVQTRRWAASRVRREPSADP